MQILLINNITKYLDQLTLLLKPHQITVCNYSDIPKTHGCFDLIILSGGHSLLINKCNESKLISEIEIIKNAPIPIIGICYGAELINYVFGGKNNEIPKIKGLIEIEPINKSFFKFTELNKFKVYESHRFAIEILAKDLLPLARSKYGFELFKHKTKGIYGMQFHPEVIKDNNSGRLIFENCINEILSRATD